MAVFHVPVDDIEYFEFQIGNEPEPRRLPLMEHVNAAIMRDIRAEALRLKGRMDKGDDLSDEDLVRVLAVQDRLLEHYHPDILEVCTQSQIERIVAAWQAASEVSLGESSASADS